MEPVSPFPLTEKPSSPALKTQHALINKDLLHTAKTWFWIQAAGLVLLAFIFTLCSSSSNAQNGWVDSGDFVEGDVGQAPNADSETPQGLQMLPPSYGGTGCPQGSATAVLSSNGSTLSVLFDQYKLEVNRAEERQAIGCELRIPFSVPRGYAVQIVKMDYRGFASLANGARSTFGAGFRFEYPGQTVAPDRVLRAAVLRGSRSGEFLVSSFIPRAGFSPCGQDFTLIAESHLNLMANRAGDQSLAMVDSMDSVQRPVRYALRWRRCNSDSGSVQPPPPDVRPLPPQQPPPRPPGFRPPGRPQPPPPTRPPGRPWR